MKCQTPLSGKLRKMSPICLLILPRAYLMLIYLTCSILQAKSADYLFLQKTGLDMACKFLRKNLSENRV